MNDFFKPSILYVDDEQANLDTFKRAFSADYLVKTCLSGLEALEILKTESYPIVIADQRMPGMTGIEFLSQVLQKSPQSIRMILTAYSEPDLLLEAINKGHVNDYIVKPWRKSDLKPILEAAFTAYKQRSAKLDELERLAAIHERLQEKTGEGQNLVGLSSGLASIVKVVEKAAPTEATLLILGETGTGKEVLAQYIHAKSLRANQAFIAINCASLSHSLLESELFGHEKGSFTGAENQKLGRFERANKGTLFLDEIGEISETVQVKLLRVLQEKVIERVGGSQIIPIDVRLVAATNKNLKELVSQGKFREDLYYRLNVISLTLPPLRDRADDILLLANHFVNHYSKQAGRQLQLTEAACGLLKSYDWPGNIRELKNVIERAVILSETDQIDVGDLAIDLSAQKLTTIPVKENVISTEGTLSQIQAMEREKTYQILKQAAGNIAEAARLLNLPRSTLVSRLKRFGFLS